jgi:hypothetical protein
VPRRSTEGFPFVDDGRIGFDVGLAGRRSPVRAARIVFPEEALHEGIEVVPPPVVPALDGGDLSNL